jgi:hypothetical protein
MWELSAAFRSNHQTKSPLLVGSRSLLSIQISISSRVSNGHPCFLSKVLETKPPGSTELRLPAAGVPSRPGRLLLASRNLRRHHFTNIRTSFPQVGACPQDLGFEEELLVPPNVLLENPQPPAAVEAPRVSPGLVRTAVNLPVKAAAATANAAASAAEGAYEVSMDVMETAVSATGAVVGAAGSALSGLNNPSAPTVVCLIEA